MKSTLDSKLNFILAPFRLFFIVHPLAGQMYQPFLYILGDPGLLWGVPFLFIPSDDLKTIRKIRTVIGNFMIRNSLLSEMNERSIFF